MPKPQSKLIGSRRTGMETVVERGFPMKCYTTSNDRTGSCRVSSKSATNEHTDTQPLYSYCGGRPVLAGRPGGFSWSKIYCAYALATN